MANVSQEPGQSVRFLAGGSSPQWREQQKKTRNKVKHKGFAVQRMLHVIFKGLPFPLCSGDKCTGEKVNRISISR